MFRQASECGFLTVIKCADEGRIRAMKCGVVVFPGSNCDHDAYHALKHVLGQETVYLWHQDETVAGCELVVLPGAMGRNPSLRFQCRDVPLRVERNDLPFTREYEPGQLVRMPIAHSAGN